MNFGRGRLWVLCIVPLVAACGRDVLTPVQPSRPAEVGVASVSHLRPRNLSLDAVNAYRCSVVRLLSTSEGAQYRESLVSIAPTAGNLKRTDSASVSLTRYHAIGFSRPVREGN